jgi:hypothetical protein
MASAHDNNTTTGTQVYRTDWRSFFIVAYYYVSLVFVLILTPTRGDTYHFAITCVI